MGWFHIHKAEKYHLYSVNPPLSPHFPRLQDGACAAPAYQGQQTSEALNSPLLMLSPQFTLSEAHQTPAAHKSISGSPAPYFKAGPLWRPERCSVWVQHQLPKITQEALQMLQSHIDGWGREVGSGSVQCHTLGVGVATDCREEVLHLGHSLLT